MHFRHSLALSILVATVACSDGPSDPAPAPPKPPESGQIPYPPGHDDVSRRSFSAPLALADAEVILRRTTIFEFGGMPPKRQVQAFNVVFEQPDAASRFRSIAETALPAGQLYALAGLLILDPSAAERVGALLSENSDTIDVSESDVGHRRQVRDLARLIEKQDLGKSFRRMRDETNSYFAERQR